jgi:predicted DNA-binding protein YlxM (UPF0122 family)
MSTTRLNIVEIRRLYEDELYSLRQIAEIVGVSHQSVHNHLRNAGVRLRYRGGASRLVVKKPEIEAAVLIGTYVDQRLSVEKVAERLGKSKHAVRKSLQAHGIKLRRPAEWVRKHPELADLNIGESLIVPRPNRRKPYSNFYSMATPLGIRLSLKTIDPETIQITRVE